jgi:type VI secretion system protein ImpB
MSDNFEREIPKTRISISVDSHARGASERTELPLKLLVLGDYSAGQATDALAVRKKIDVNKTNFNAVLTKLNPRIEVELAIKEEVNDRNSGVTLRFKTMKDFEPDNVARQIPELQRLIAMRKLLSDLKLNWLGNVGFRNHLELILKDPGASASLKADLSRAAMRPDT